MTALALSNYNSIEQAQNDPSIDVIWKPLKGSQEILMNLNPLMIDELLLTGSRGTGKSEASLMYLLRWFIGRGYGSDCNALFTDLSYNALEDLISKSKKIIPKLYPDAKFYSAAGNLKWQFTTGETIYFRAVDADSVLKLHGHSYNFISVNELTKHPDDSVYTYLQTLNRHGYDHEKEGTEELANIMVSTTNPGSVGSAWVKQHFIDPAPYGVINRTKMKVYSPKEEKEIESETRRLALFSSYKENPFLPISYVRTLEGIKDLRARACYLHGDFSYTMEGLFSDCWDSNYNVVPNFKPPKSWLTFRGYDYGSASCASSLIFAQSDGTDIVFDDGTKMPTVKGDLFVVGEVYFWSGVPNKGIRMLASKQAVEIIKEEVRLGIHDQVRAGAADASIYTSFESINIAETMANPVMIDGVEYNGPTYVPSIKVAGSRAIGHELMRELMQRAKPEKGVIRELPALFVCQRCEQWLRTVPSIDIDPKKEMDCPQSAEDHCFTADTKVLLADGTTPTIESLIGTTGLIQTSEGPQQYRNARLVKRNQQTIILTFSDGSTVECTPDHEFYLHNGERVRADNIHRYADLLTSPKTNIQKPLTVVEVAVGRTKDVYCLTVPTTGNFALANGAIVSNCLDNTRYQVLALQSSFRITTSRSTGHY